MFLSFVLRQNIMLFTIVTVAVGGRWFYTGILHWQQLLIDELQTTALEGGLEGLYIHRGAYTGALSVTTINTVAMRQLYCTKIGLREVVRFKVADSGLLWEFHIFSLDP